MICHSPRVRVVLHFFLRESRTSETREHVKITPREKGDTRGVVFTRPHVSFALLSLRKNGGLLVVYHSPDLGTVDLGCDRKLEVGWRNVSYFLRQLKKSKKKVKRLLYTPLRGFSAIQDKGIIPQRL